jgi:hypothetical protein
VVLAAEQVLDRPTGKELKAADLVEDVPREHGDLATEDTERKKKANLIHDNERGGVR